MRFLSRSFVIAAACFGRLRRCQDLTIVSKVTRDGRRPSGDELPLLGHPDVPRRGPEVIVDYKLGQMITIDNKKKTYSVTTQKDIDAWIARCGRG